MQSIRTLIVALGLSLILSLTIVPAAFAKTTIDTPTYAATKAAPSGSTSFYLKVINPPPGATMWCGDWFWNPIGPLQLNDVAHVVNVPSQGNPSIPYSDHLWVIIKNQFGESFLQYNEQPNFVAQDGQLYVFDCQAKTLTTQAPEPPVTLDQPMPLVSFGFRVANMPADADSWSVTTLTPFGENILYGSGQLAPGDIVSITNTSAVNCLLIQTYSQGTPSSQFFDWFTGKDGADYVYDFLTTRITESTSRPVITTTTLPSGITGIAYSKALAASGGAGGYTWSVSSGSFPAWAQLDVSTGQITGVPDIAGSSTFIAQVADRANATATKTLSININPPPKIRSTSHPVVTTTTLPSGITGVAYSKALVASGGARGYTWSVSSGSFPAWANLDASTGKITGVPDTAGSSTFIAQVADRASATATKTLSININPPPEIRVTSPSGGESFEAGLIQNISWTSAGITGNVRIQLSRDGGTTWKTIISSTPNDGSQAWTVTGPATDQARIKVVSVRTPAVFDASDANFTILQSITVTGPNGGEEWAIGSSQTFAWTSVGITGTVRIQLSRNGGKTWQTIVNSTPNDGSYAWTVKGPATDQAMIKVVSVRPPAVVDVSDVDFRITP